MARIRTIKPEFFTSLSIAGLPLRARLTFIGLWTHVDDEGKCLAEPRLIKAAIWPLDDVSAEDVMSDLGALTEASLIAHYEVANRRYLAVKGWSEHQRISRPSSSNLPNPDAGTPIALSSENSFTEDSVNAHGILTEPSPPERKGKEQGKEGKEPSSEIPSEVSNVDPEIALAVDRICEHLADRIVSNGSSRPRISKKWRDAARLMQTADALTEDQIHRAIDWCQDNEFWRSIIRSVPKLRDKFETLRMQAARPSARSAVAAPRPSTTDQRVSAAMELAQKFAAQEAIA